MLPFGPKKARLSHPIIGTTSFDAEASSSRVHVSPTPSSQRHESLIVVLDSPEAQEVHVVKPPTIVPYVFLGGPSDLSLLPLCPDHAGSHMWDGEVT